MEKMLEARRRRWRGAMLFTRATHGAQREALVTDMEDARQKYLDQEARLRLESEQYRAQNTLLSEQVPPHRPR